MSKDGAVAGYDSGEFFCEIFGRPKGRGLGHTRRVRERLAQLEISQLRDRSRGAERELFNLGITFTVYTDREAIDRILPFDVIPRLLSSKDWEIIDSGVKQRVAALNLFLYDIYHDEKILKDGIVPRELVLG
ncbi:MAG: circularly permuted type 2 ATP-grasp protein, partial [Alphaproteobacteria bacterium]|nr:circularly permuted type 2 ATP-grasp protein [Alphaproteobacteria bacterium]